MSAWRAVLDAQVWVSGAISADGPARAIIAAARTGRFRIFTSPYVRAEVQEVLQRPSVRSLLAPGFAAQEWMESVEIVAADVVAHVSGPPIVTADPDDDPYLWTAWAGSATHVVTWDAEVLALKHFRSVRIVDPRRFLDELRTRGAITSEGTAPAAAPGRRPRGKSLARNRSAGVRASIASTRVTSTTTGSSRASGAAGDPGARDTGGV